MSLFQAYLRKPSTQRVLKSKPGDQGFSLIELVVVIAVLAVLTAIALPNFLGVSEDASARTAQQGVLNAFKECKVLWARNKRDDERYFVPPAITDWAIRSREANAAFNTGIPNTQPAAETAAVRCFDDNEASRDLYAYPLSAPGKFPSYKITADGTKQCITGNKTTYPETYNIGCDSDNSEDQAIWD